jgi:hypothetical protein
MQHHSIFSFKWNLVYIKINSFFPSTFQLIVNSSVQWCGTQGCCLRGPYEIFKKISLVEHGCGFIFIKIISVVFSINTQSIDG